MGIIGLAGRRKKFEKYNSCNTKWNKKSLGLVVFTHGLLANPFVWNGYIKKVSSTNPGIDIRAPMIPYLGNCSLETAAAPLLELLKSYCKKHPKQAIYLVGHSNGARINSYLEVNLREEQNCISLTSIAGLNRGTSVINQINSLPPIGFFLSKAFRREAVMFGKFSESLFFEQQKMPPKGKRKYLYIATPEDRHIPDKLSTLPRMKHSQTRYYLASGEGHVSILFHSREFVCDEIKKALKRPDMRA